MSAPTNPKTSIKNPKEAIFDFYKDEKGVLRCREVTHLYTDHQSLGANADISKEKVKSARRRLFTD